MRPLALILLVVAASACDDSLIELEQPYLLTAINGQPIPWAGPGDTSANPARITEGWVTIHRGGIAERHEEIVRGDPSDSMALRAFWTQAGPYEWQDGRILVTYPFWSPGQPGPTFPVETLSLSRRGITLRQLGFIPPIDSMVRFYGHPNR